MRRRSLLTSVTGCLTALAGCNGLGDGSSARTGTREPFSVPTTGSGTTESDAPGLRSRAVSTLGDTPVELAIADVGTAADRLGYRVGFTEDGTPKHPPRLSIAATNTGETAATFRFEGVEPFGSYVGTYEARTTGPDAARNASEPPRLLLVPTNDERFDVAWSWETEGCWRFPKAFRPPEITESVDLNPGEEVEREYDIVTPDDGDCLLPGVYRFRDDRGTTFTVSVWESTRPPASRFGDVTVPDLPACATRWFHETDGEIFIEPTSESVTTPVPVRFTLHDLSDQRVVPTAVRVFKLRDGEWLSLLPTPAGELPAALFPGETETRTLRLGGEPRSIGDRSALPGLRSGRYAVFFGAFRDLETVNCVAALFDVTAGSRVRLSPSPFVGTPARDAGTGTLVVAATPAGSESLPEDDSATVELSRAPGRDPQATFVLEQVFQRQALRDTLAFLHGDETIDSVRLTTTADAVAQVLGPAPDRTDDGATEDDASGEEATDDESVPNTERTFTFQFDGTVYRATTPVPE
ncbi:hypothetical protein [Haloarchaeobius sp. TZWSO28]|uniref:hypothetical protein n=1 Tax=Haloarchaeobius sp. TZWSO28 TaxID=3446119 RepID=UPI003EB9E82F